jgi:RNA polymerase sigma-70 factor (ECF subfamily)
VLDRYERPLVRYAMRITGELHAARDAVQETLLRLMREERSKIEPHLAAWLYTVCRHRALDAKRKEKRMPTLDHDHVAERPAAGRDHEQAADDRDHCRQIGAVLATLSANQQEVVRLKFQEGLSYKEIAQVTDLSVTNVGYLIHTAIAKLREKLGNAEV